MTTAEKHAIRDALARAAGYRHAPVPPDAEWAGINLPDHTDESAALAALRVRGLPVNETDKRA